MRKHYLSLQSFENTINRFHKRTIDYITDRDDSEHDFISECLSKSEDAIDRLLLTHKGKRFKYKSTSTFKLTNTTEHIKEIRIGYTLTENKLEFKFMTKHLVRFKTKIKFCIAINSRKKINTTANKNTLGEFTDTLLGVPYELSIYKSAKILSEKLKKTYTNLDINIEDYSKVRKTNSPPEIYEYQNFFLLKKDDGNVVLLDGFRRLLIYDVPDSEILVRTYKESDLSDSDILSLLLNLNHFKFFTNNEYHENGFGLVLKTVFDININKYRKAFNSYLSSSDIKNMYYINKKTPEHENTIIKERITNPLFIKDMRFLHDLTKSECAVNRFFGALLYSKRKESQTEFDSNKFIELHNSNKVLPKLMLKYEKNGVDGSTRSQDVVNQIQEIYNGFFEIMSGGVAKKSFAEKEQEYISLRAKLNKDKEWTKITGKSDYYLYEKEIKSRLKKNNTTIKMKGIIKPKKSYNNQVPLKYGLWEDIIFLGYKNNNEMVFGFTDPETNTSWVIRHNYSAYGFGSGSGKRYTRVWATFDQEVREKYNASFSSEYDIEVWVNIPRIKN